MSEAESILVVEDDPEINRLIGAYAQIAGFSYRPALNGAEAMNELAGPTPTVVVLDLMLPDVSGLELCRRIRSNHQMDGVPVIILTALDSEKSRQEGMRSGADAYLTKPFDPDELMETLSHHARRNGTVR